MSYQIGICYGCQKCLYCGTTENCECDKTTKPTKNNRTEEVKTAYCRFYKSTLTNEQKEFLKDRKSLFKYNSKFNYLFRFSLCAMCHSSFQRKKSLNTSKSLSNTTNHLDESATLSDSSNIDNFSDNDIDNISNNISEVKKILFSLSVKLENKIELPSKFIEISVSSIDELLLEIYNHLIILIEDNTIFMDDYFIAYKLEKTTGAGTQLKDANDFKKFILDYEKTDNRKKNFVIIVTMKKKIKKRKEKVNIFY